MEKRCRIISIFALAFFVTASCTDKEQEPPHGSEFIVHASFDSQETRVSLEQADNLSLTSKWNANESFDLFVDLQEVGKDVPIVAISEDKKNCSFVITLPDVENKSGNRLFCATSPAHAALVDGKYFCNASLVRSSLQDFNAPVFASSEISDWIGVSIRFKHYLVYEVVHVKNQSDRMIQFSHCGFESDDGLWYQTKGAVAIDDGTFLVDAESASAPVMKNEPIVLQAGEDGIIISSYRANGKKISKARMVAEVDGQPVRTTNTRSSDLDLQFGHAYHMYVVWDGAALHFINGSGGSEVDAGGFGYEAVGTGDVAGSGLGYGSDSSGDVTGGGSGYGADGSGDLSGRGSGYSNGN